MSAIDRTVEVHGFALREIRELRGRTVADLAGALGVDQSYIRHLENGSKRRVGPELFHTLCAELLVRDSRALLAVAPVRPQASARPEATHTSGAGPSRPAAQEGDLG